MDRDDLLTEIETHAALVGIAPATLTGRAVGNSRLYARMKAGGGCNILVAARLRAYLAALTVVAENPSPEQDVA